jgi:molecular chaperone HtpG
VLEVNAEHALVKKLAALPEGSGTFDDLAQVLFDNALLAEGGQLDDPAAHVRRIQTLILG